LVGNDVIESSEQGLDSRAFALAGYIFLAGPIGMPQDIVERLSGLMVEAGKTDRIQKLLDTNGIGESAQRAHRLQDAVRQRNAHLGGRRDGIGVCG
jgi:tripartite-type tricarboxylate transporter receptor subunit TctC